MTDQPEGPAQPDQAAKPRRGPGRPRHEEPSEAFLARRDQIVETAALLFGRIGYHAGSLEDLAGELGLGKASLYHYVSSKGELLNLVFDRAISGALTELDRIAGIADPADRLAELVRHQVHMIMAEPSFFSVFFDQHHLLEEKFAADIDAKQRRYLRTFVEAVEDAMAAGHIPAGDPRDVAQLVLGMTSWPYKWCREGRDDPTAVAQAAVRLLGLDRS
ncbi:MAG: TetR/AcrR family transcriptional regulator [Actinomycetia bacterium]|nr:TetR/AcrR family transcriptional regulator [Actinomycetes bacterium]